MRTRKDMPNRMPLQIRSTEVRAEAMNADKRTVEISFSSELPASEHSLA
jgi:hypothetical protein